MLQNLKHFKALPKVLSVGILKEVADGAILESRAKLALPELAGERVVSVGHQEGIIAGRGKTRGSEPEEDEIPQLQIILTQLDG